jgi:hypothetical protein
MQFELMRITVELDESILKELGALTGETKKSPAVAKAVEDFVRRGKMKEFGRLLREGAFQEAFEPDYNPSAGDQAAPTNVRYQPSKKKK